MCKEDQNPESPLETATDDLEVAKTTPPQSAGDPLGFTPAPLRPGDECPDFEPGGDLT